MNFNFHYTIVPQLGVLTWVHMLLPTILFIIHALNILRWMSISSEKRFSTVLLKFTIYPLRNNQQSCLLSLCLCLFLSFNFCVPSFHFLIRRSACGGMLNSKTSYTSFCYQLVVKLISLVVSYIVILCILYIPFIMNRKTPLQLKYTKLLFC